jgi:transcriptional regulator with XRE-family HTH domain
MLDSRASELSSDASLDYLKEFSGRRIESERLRRRISQKHFARRVGLSVRWLREIESGNPAVKLDDHLRCAAALHLAPAVVLLPLLDPDYNRPSPIYPAPSELADIEYLIWTLIARRAGWVTSRDEDFAFAGDRRLTEVRDPAANQLRGARSSPAAQPWT